jgi:hypothetical protein
MMPQRRKTFVMPRHRKMLVKKVPWIHDFQEARLAHKFSFLKLLLRVVQIRTALLTRTGSKSKTESDTGDVSLGAGSTQKVETRGKDLFLS